jgi:voltage-gated potassium channel
MKRLWMDIFEVTFSLVMAIWVPLKLLYFTEPWWLDFALDGLCLAWFALKVYERGWRRTDFFNLFWALPLFSIVVLSPYHLIFSVGLLHLTKFLFVPRILKVLEVLEKFDNLHPIFYRLISVGTILPVIIHVQTCIWIALGSGTAGPDLNSFAEYVKALYWTITTLTTIGYGDISAKTIPQMLFSSVAEVIGVAFFGFVLSNVASLLARMDAAREHHLSTLDQVENFIRYNDLPKEFRTKIRGYYRYLWEHHRGFDDKSILDSLPRLLKAEASFLLNKDIVPKVPFLKNAPVDLLEDIVLQLRPVIAVPREHLFYRGEVGDTMYLIRHGEVEILGPDGEVIVTLQDGGFFGEMSLLLDAPRSATAQAKTYCDLFVLEKKAFEQVIEKHPGFRKYIEEVVQERTARVA